VSSPAGGREYAVTLAVGTATAGLVLLAAGQPWAESSVISAGMPRQDVAVVGAAAATGMRASALVVLAALAATLVTTGRWRQLVGAVLLVAGAGVSVSAVLGGTQLRQTVRVAAADTAAGADSTAVDRAVRAADVTGWPWVAGMAGVLVAVVGLAVVVRGARWPGMSRRYERGASQHRPAPAQSQPGQFAEPGERTDAQDLWRALDEGRDPTR